MSRLRFVSPVVLVVAVLIALPSPAAAERSAPEPLIVDLSKRRIEITTGFSGATILLFGATDKPGDIVVAVRGPLGRAVLRRKGQVAGLWINRDQWVFDNVPYFYRLATNRRIEETLPDEIIDEYEIGQDRLEFVPKDAMSEKTFAAGRSALLRRLNEEGLYSDRVGEVDFIAPGLFNVRFDFPANIHVGDYHIEVYLLRFGAVVSRQVLPLEVRKIGVGAQVFRFAHEHPAAYGAIAIAMALIAGWLASVFFRKS